MAPWIEQVAAYRVVHHRNLERFEHLVAQAINDGFEPYDGFRTIQVDGAPLYMQPMVKRVRVEE